MGDQAVAEGKKSARRRGALIVFQDESGFSLLASVRSTWAPRGKTPVLRHHFSWKRLSMAGVLAYEPDGTDAQLVFQMRPGAYNDESLIEFLTEMHTLLEDRLLTLIWDGLASHRSRRMKEWLSTQRSWLLVEQLPAYGHDLNPIEKVWGNLKAKRARQPLPRHHRRGCWGSRRGSVPDRRRDRTLPCFPPSHCSQAVTTNPRYYTKLFNPPRSNTRYYRLPGFGSPTRFFRSVVPCGSGSPGHYGDCASQEGNPAYSCVRGDQGRTEVLGESDVTGVVGRDVVPKLPDPVEEGENRITDQPKLPPGVECRPSNCFIDLS